MRRDHPTTPFDVEAEEMTRQFWGASKSWVSSEQATVRRRAERSGAARSADDTTGSLRVIREGFAAFRPQTSGNATGEIARQRRHGVPQRSDFDPSPSPGREATLAELAAGRSDAGGWSDDLDDPYDAPAARHTAARHDTVRHDTFPERAAQRDGRTDDQRAEYEVPLSPVQPLVDRLGLGAVDPLLVRAGMLALTLLLLVPLVLSLRPDRADTLGGDVVETPQPAVGAAPATADTDQGAVEALTTASVTAESPADGPATTAVVTTLAATAPPDGGAAVASTASAADDTVAERTASEAAQTVEQQAVVVDDAAAVDVVAERMVPACPQTYTAAAGDSWYRIADEAGVTPRELLAENTATTETVILPGDDICLPAGASMPAPPTTGPTPTTEPVPATDPTPTTEVPSTTTPSTTVAPVANLSRAEVQQLIRETWPEEEVDKALAVAERESKFVATADNGWCCVGVFQIYWSVHRSWLDDFGISERSDLYDARKNIAAAFHMWQSSGWGPWGG